jgi:hypothetical protein
MKQTVVPQSGHIADAPMPPGVLLHTVWWMTPLSWASNYALATDLAVYVGREQTGADMMRQRMRDAGSMELQG